MRHGLILALLTVGVLSGCASKQVTLGSLEHYDKCSENNTSFVSMIECGKRSRSAYCSKDNSCSGSGNANVAYGDSLVMSVKKHELTEAEAWRKWITYRNSREDAEKSLAAAEAAAEAAKDAAEAAREPKITNCETSKKRVNCYSF
jgi:hypothetical protein